MQKNKNVEKDSVSNTSEEAALKLEREKEVKEMKEVASKLDVILKEHGYGLQPFIIGPWVGGQNIEARVRLVKMPKEQTDESKDTETTGEEGSGEQE